MAERRRAGHPGRQVLAKLQLQSNIRVITRYYTEHVGTCGGWFSCLVLSLNPLLHLHPLLLLLLPHLLLILPQPLPMPPAPRSPSPSLPPPLLFIRYSLACCLVLSSPVANFSSSSFYPFVSSFTLTNISFSFLLVYLFL